MGRSWMGERKTMGVIETLLLTTLLAGVGGTGLGGLIGALLQKDSKRTVSLLLSFAGGVMISVVCFDLVTEAIETDMGIWTVVGAIAFGVAVTYFLNYLIDRKTNPEVPHIDENHPKTADDLDELIHSDHFHAHHSRQDGKLGLFVAGVVMACAIALHNVPEGMTIGASYARGHGGFRATDQRRYGQVEGCSHYGFLRRAYDFRRAVRLSVGRYWAGGSDPKPGFCQRCNAVCGFWRDPAPIHFDVSQ